MVSKQHWVDRRTARLKGFYGVDQATAREAAQQDWQALKGAGGPRFCCDQQCQQGRHCPAFAPGVIEGPYRRSARLKAETQVAAANSGVRGFLRLVWDYLTGPRP